MQTLTMKVFMSCNAKPCYIAELRSEVDGSIPFFNGHKNKEERREYEYFSHKIVGEPER